MFSVRCEILMPSEVWQLLQLESSSAAPPLWPLRGLAAAVAGGAHLLAFAELGEALVVERQPGVVVALLHERVTLVDLVDHGHEVARDFAVGHVGVGRVAEAGDAGDGIDRSRLLQGREADRRSRGGGRHLRPAVGALVGVADHAITHLHPRAAAVEGKLAVADVAVVDRDVLARQLGRCQHLAGGRNEVVGDIHGVGHVHGRGHLGTGRRIRARAGCRAADLDRQPVRQVGRPGQVAQVFPAVVAAVGESVDDGLGAGNVAVEGVLVGTWLAAHGLQLALVVGAGAGGGKSARRGVDAGDDIAHPGGRLAVGARHQLGDGERQVGVTAHRCGGRLGLQLLEAFDRTPLIVDDREFDDRRAGNGDAADGGGEAGVLPLLG